MRAFLTRALGGGLTLLAIAVAAHLPARGQIVPRALDIGLELGPGYYFGEFNSLDEKGALSPETGFDIDLNLRYNVASNFTVGAMFGRMQLSYGINDYVRRKYGANFFGRLGDSLYPLSDVAITGTNRISVTKYILFAQSDFEASSTLVPYFMLGFGLIQFSISNDRGEELPTAFTGSYTNRTFVMPIGGGLRYYLNDRLNVNLQGLVYLTGSDYIDGYAHFLDFDEHPGAPGPGGASTPADYLGSVSVGVSYSILRPGAAPPEEEPEPEPEPPPAIAEERPPVESPAEPPVAEQPPAVEETPVEHPPVASTPDTAAIAQEVPAPVEKPSRPAFDPYGAANDSDGDGLTDEEEVNRYKTDPYNPDSDGDYLSDSEEILRYNTSPNNPDTDHDGLNDGSEVMVFRTDPLVADSDHDGLNDGEEIRQYRTNPLREDTDKDLLTDGVEVTRTLSDPRNPDSDGDGVIDGLDACPKVPGDPANHGCPPELSPRPAPTAVQPSGPLAGLPRSVEEGDRADFSGIYFKINSDDFDFTRPETARNLSAMLDFLRQCDEVGVVIEGHTSADGSARWNQKLSEKRAARVRDWLLANGIAPGKILGTVGYGSLMPKVPEPSGGAPPAMLERIRRQNRRITAMVRRRCP